MHINGFLHMNISIKPPLKLYRILQHPRRLTSTPLLFAFSLGGEPQQRGREEGSGLSIYSLAPSLQGHIRSHHSEGQFFKVALLM